MSFKSIITKNVVSETLSKVVSFLSSASLNLSSEQIKTLVDSKIKNTNVIFAEDNDIGYCVSRLMDNCAYGQVKTEEELIEQYPTLRADDDLITETIDMMAESITKQISSSLYELREIIPQETKILVEQINKQIPVVESLQQKETELTMFNWGKLNDQSFLASTMLSTRDKTGCMKDGVVRQHDCNNILRRVPYGTTEKFQTNAAFETAFSTIMSDAIDDTVLDDSKKAVLKNHLKSAISFISNDKFYHYTLTNLKENLTNTVNLSANIVSVVEKLDAMEDVLRLVTVELLGKDESVSVFSSKILSNVETALINISLVRGSLVFHKIHTLQGRLILSKTSIQESAFEAFCQGGGSMQMIFDHLTYMDINELSKIPSNGLSLDVVLNSSAKARAVVQKHTDAITARANANRVKATQDAIMYGLEIHYKTSIESGAYRPTLEVIHEKQVSASVSGILKKTVDDIALEYLVTMRNNLTMKSFFKSINAELHGLVKNENIVTQEMIQTAVCSGVVSVIFESLVKEFSVQKEAA